jgi:hypothetical protein
VNIVQILCTHVYKWKNNHVETIPEIGGEMIKENDEEGEFKYDIFDINHKNFCKCHIIPPPSTTMKKLKKKKRKIEA